MSRLPRAARTAITARVLGLIVAAPTAAAQPTRTVMGGGPGTRYSRDSGIGREIPSTSAE